jgi:protein-S-isoprenylcysteine O-methyltransferase Ste14
MVLVVAVATPLFAAAGTIRFWQAWALLSQLFASMIATNVYLLKTAPDLLERRLPANREVEPGQRLGMMLLRVAALAMFATAGFDRRLGWSQVPSWLTDIAFGVAAGGALLVFLVLRENRFASLTIEVAAEQRVVATGPYRWVRHPMYLGALLQGFALPLALGSYWAEVIPALACAVLVGRLLGEERLLLVRLPGYSAYVQRTRCRLIPGVW